MTRGRSPAAWAGIALAALGGDCAAGVAGRSAPAARFPEGAPRAGYFVAPGGSAQDSGTLERPWDLATALAGGGGRLRAGDTVWLRGGIYHGAFRTSLHGEPGRWIVFRQYPGERATIDGTLRADGAYLGFWGFEIMQSTPTTYGLQANTDHGRFINLIVHDAGTQGVSFWTPAVDAELYGCIVYNNGTHENLDHGTYVHNEAGTKRIIDNVFFNNLARGIQIYASPRNPVLRNIWVEGNVAFGNGTISSAVAARQNLIFNAPVPTEGMVGVGNLLYFAGDEGINLRLGRYAPEYNRDIELRDNYIVGGRIGIEMDQPWQRATVIGNVIVGSRELVRLRGAGASLSNRYRWVGNTWVGDATSPAWRYEDTAYDWDAWRRASQLGDSDRVVPALPAEATVVVRPNQYEPGRAHMVVYNWARQPEVVVDLGRVLRPGDRYEVRNVQALFGPPAATGVYDGSAIRLSMAGVPAPVPIGRATATPPRTGPAFDVFLVTSPSR